MIALPLLVLLVVVTAPMVIALAVAAERAPRRRKITGPVCGNCGYSVTGLERMTCPECGGDLRTAGILTPTTPQPASVALAAMMFTLLLGFIALVATAGLESVVPERHSYTRQVQLGPLSSGYPNVLVQTSRSSWGGNLVPAPVTIELEAASAKPTALPERMTVRADGGYESTTVGRQVTGTGEFGERAVLDWWKVVAIDTTAADVRQKAARIAAEVRIAARSGRAALQQSSGGASFSSSSSSGGDPTDVFQNHSLKEIGESHSPVAPLIVMALFWLAVWLWGLRHLTVPGARRRRATTAAPVPAASK